GPHACPPPDREHDYGHRCCWLSAGVHAWRRLAAGTAHHDCPSVQPRNEKGTGQEDCSHPVISEQIIGTHGMPVSAYVRNFYKKKGEKRAMLRCTVKFCGGCNPR